MIKISIITVFPELYENFIKTSLINRAVEQGVVEFNFIRFSDICQPKERIDEPTVGHGAGMIIKPEVIRKAIEQCQEKWGPGFKIFFSPQGQKLDQQKLTKLYEKLTTGKSEDPFSTSEKDQGSHLMLVCSRYEGIDERVETSYADLVLSIGDYVLMGGDLPAQVFLEGFLRLFPTVVGKTESVEKESFQGPFLDHPEFGLPVEWNGLNIPEVLRSGNHKQIDEWRKEQACKKTVLNRFDWLRESHLTNQEIELSRKFIPPHYVVIMHSQIVIASRREQIDVKDKTVVGDSSVASIDIHDIARSCATYGIKNFFIVTQLEDQFKIVNTFLSFWHSERGKSYNPSRFQAVECVIPTKSFQSVLQEIKARENADPLIITTSAKSFSYGIKIDYSSQGLVWKHNRPVLIVFGTGQGLSDEIMEQSDFILTPVQGLTSYNHLSVRSAAAIVLDRWLGLNPEIE